MPSSHRSLHGVRERQARENEARHEEDPDMIVAKLLQRQGGGLQVDDEMPESIAAPTGTKGLDQTTALAQATDMPSPEATQPPAGQDDFTSASLIPEPTETSSASSSDGGNEGTNPAVIAGIVMGVLGGVLVIGFLVYFIVSRRRKQQNQDRDSEKINGSGMETRQVQPAQRPPRVSLRPVTQLFGWGPDKPAAKGNTLSPGLGNRNLGPNAFERPDTSQSMHPNNPFGNQAERVPTPVMEEHSMEDRRVDRSLPPTPASEAKNDPMAAAGSNLVRKTSMRKDGPKNLDLTLNLNKPLEPVPASPAGTDFSAYSSDSRAPESQSSAAIAAAGGPANTVVHRVQLDFKPTLEDEMELRAGELVRLLHEYDDGWALCIRMDRSKQGVVPRTCLSTRPVKPRAPPGAPRPGQRPAPGPQQRSMTPQGYRPESPSRPRGPASPGRPMSPGPRFQGQQAGRPRSPSNLSKSTTVAPGPSPMNPQAQSPDPARLPGMAL